VVAVNQEAGDGLAIRSKLPVIIGYFLTEVRAQTRINLGHTDAAALLARVSLKWRRHYQTAILSDYNRLSGSTANVNQRLFAINCGFCAGSVIEQQLGALLTYVMLT
jgi:hypothetical protein